MFEPSLKFPKSARNNTTKILADEESIAKIKGEFSVTKPFGNDEVAERFSVTNPHKPKGCDYIVYIVTVSLLG